MKKKIVVCSKNPVKITSVRAALRSLHIPYTLLSIECPSGVSDQPMSEKEALEGARNRIAYARSVQQNIDMFIAIESGIRFCEITKKYFDFSYSVVQGVSANNEGISKSSEFKIDDIEMHFINNGSNLSQASFLVHNQKDVGSTIGISGIKSNLVIPRKTLHFQPNVFAIADFLRTKNADISPSRAFRKFERTFLPNTIGRK